MKFLLILACLALYVAQIQAQWTCRGLPRLQSCFGLQHEGNGGSGACHRNANRDMWYYSRNSGACGRLKYLGCGGNGNRYCSREDCERKCRWAG